MSRIAKKAIVIPAGVELDVVGAVLSLKKGGYSLNFEIPNRVSASLTEGQLHINPVDDEKISNMMAGTVRSIVANMLVGVSSGFERKLQLVGVGYRAQAKDKVLNLSLGFSHPIVYEMPDGVEVQTPSQTEILLRGIDKQAVGQVAAEIRSFRPPEPYKGKGVRYDGEIIRMKEAKKK